MKKFLNDKLEKAINIKGINIAKMAPLEAPRKKGIIDNEIAIILNNLIKKFVLVNNIYVNETPIIKALLYDRIKGLITSSPV